MRVLNKASGQEWEALTDMSATLEETLQQSNKHIVAAKHHNQSFVKDTEGIVVSSENGLKPLACSFSRQHSEKICY